MKQVLIITSSLANDRSQSNALVAFAKQQWQGQAQFVERDVQQLNLPHLSAEEMAAWQMPAAQRSAEQQRLALWSDELIAELQAADAVVLAVPMYNFGIPSALKAYIDRIARAGVTFRYTAQGPEGLVLGKKLVVVATRGGLYAGTPKDSQTQFLKDFFNFIGIGEQQFIYAEGLAMGPESAEAALANAKQQLQALAI